MEGQIQHLKEQLDAREYLVENLSSTVVEMKEKMSSLETLNQTAVHRIGYLFSPLLMNL